MATTTENKRRGKRGNRVGLLVTLALHGGLLVTIAVVHSQATARAARQRHFVLAEIVKFGKQPDGTELPRITQPPQPTVRPQVPKVVDDPNARPARDEAPRPEDSKIAKQPKDAPRFPRPIDSPELEVLDVGVADAPANGTSAKTIGDRYLAEIASALRQNYFLPAGMAPQQLSTPPVIRFRFGDDGTISDVTLAKPSGNPLLDDACLQAARVTRKVPAPPPAFSPRAIGVACEK